MKSYENGKDVFGNEGDSTNDHIYPVAKDGSNSKDNIQLLTQESNVQKGDLTKGYINDIRFSITKAREDTSGYIIGEMSILLNGEWSDVSS